MRITVHSAPTQQRFAVALTLTDRWLTTKTAADVVRLFLKRFDAKHGTASSDDFNLDIWFSINLFKWDRNIFSTLDTNKNCSRYIVVSLQ